MNKEQIYDEQIDKHVDAIIAVCEKHGISMVIAIAIPTDDKPDYVMSVAGIPAYNVSNVDNGLRRIARYLEINTDSAQ